jgi:hypothetical protein
MAGFLGVYEWMNGSMDASIIEHQFHSSLTSEESNGRGRMLFDYLILKGFAGHTRHIHGADLFGDVPAVGG